MDGEQKKTRIVKIVQIWLQGPRSQNHRQKVVGQVEDCQEESMFKIQATFKGQCLSKKYRRIFVCIQRTVVKQLSTWSFSTENGEQKSKWKVIYTVCQSSTLT